MGSWYWTFETENTFRQCHWKHCFSYIISVLTALRQCGI